MPGEGLAGNQTAALNLLEDGTLWTGCEGGRVSVWPLREGQGGTEGLGALGGRVLFLWAGPGRTELSLGAFAQGAESQSGRGVWPTLSILYTGKIDISTEENVVTA